MGPPRATCEQGRVKTAKLCPGRKQMWTGEARKLTSNLKQATSAQKLREILDEAVDDPIFNFIHASAGLRPVGDL